MTCGSGSKCATQYITAPHNGKIINGTMVKSSNDGIFEWSSHRMVSGTVVELVRGFHCLDHRLVEWRSGGVESYNGIMVQWRN